MTALKERQKPTINSRRRGLKSQRRKHNSMIELQETCLKGRKTWIWGLRIHSQFSYTASWYRHAIHSGNVSQLVTHLLLARCLILYNVHTSSLILPLTLQGEETEALSLLWAHRGRKWQKGDLYPGVGVCVEGGGWGMGLSPDTLLFTLHDVACHPVQ